MINLVINFTKCSPSSTIASNRIAKFIADKTGFQLIDDYIIAKTIKGEIGSIYVVNGMFGFSNFREECVRLCTSANQLIWVGNDYNIKIPSQLKRFNFLKVCQYKTNENEYLLDWNKLTFKKARTQEPKLDKNLLYYGAFRENRIPAFKRYFNSDLYKTVISTTPKNKKNFFAINPKAQIIPPFKELIKGIRYFFNTIYIEDEIRPEGIYITPANRFYECVSAEVLQLFDINTMPSFKEYVLDDYIVSSPNDALNKMNNKFLLKQQRDYFNKYDFYNELITDFFIFHNKHCYYKQATKIELKTIQKTLF